MPEYTTQDIRNVALVEHGGAGKTMLAESLLAAAGAIGAKGEITRGTTVFDFDQQEKDHQHSLYAAVASLDHDGRHVNLVDCPGYPDFLGRALSVLPAVETAAVVVDARAGVQLATRRMMDAAGARGMVRGQALDIAAEGPGVSYSMELVEETQALKTGALIEWSAVAGAVLGQADTRHLAAYATALGRAFQIADDILDVTGDEAAAGKRLGKDDAAGKATFVSLLGLEGAQRRAADLVQAACDALHPYGDDAVNLRAAAEFVISRQT